jgi:hypothetical protein
MGRPEARLILRLLEAVKGAERRAGQSLRNSKVLCQICDQLRLSVPGLSIRPTREFVMAGG